MSQFHPLVESAYRSSEGIVVAGMALPGAEAVILSADGIAPVEVETDASSSFSDQIEAPEDSEFTNVRVHNVFDARIAYPSIVRVH